MQNLSESSPPIADTIEKKRKQIAKLLRAGQLSEQNNLSSEQRRLWMLLQLGEEVNTEYLFAYAIQGLLDFAVLQQSFAEVIQQNPVLRSTFKEMLNVPFCSEQPNMAFSIQRISAAGVKANLQNDSINIETLSKLGIDLTKRMSLAAGPLLQVFLIMLTKDQHYLIFKTSRFIFDNISANAIIKQVLSHYESFEGYQPTLKSSVNSYNDYSVKEKSWLKGSEYQRQLAYWRERLEDLPPLQLPTDRPRPVIKTHHCNSIIEEFPSSLVSLLESYAEKKQIAMETVILSGLMSLLSQYARQSDVTIGIGDHRSVQDEALIGPVENVLPLRVKINNQSSFNEMVRQINKNIHEVREFGKIPFANLIEELNPVRDLSRTPFFQTLFSYQDLSQGFKTASGLNVNQKIIVESNTDVDLSFTIRKINKKVYLSIDFNVDLYDAATICQVASHLIKILELGLNHSDVPMSTLSILDEREKNKILKLWNLNHQDYSIQNCIHELFQLQAKKTPNAIAVFCQSNTITYQELDEKSNQLANYLESLGLSKEAKVAICLYPSVEIVIAILAVLKAGYVYVPLDPEYPLERLNYILHDSKASLLITQNDTENLLKMNSIKQLQMDKDWPKISSFTYAEPKSEISANNLAYLIYTSGSTGTAKAVMVSHQGIVNNLLWRQKMWPLYATDKVLQNTSFSFDPSVWATFWPLITGAQVIITPTELHYDTRALVQLLKTQKVTLFGTVPSLISLLMDEPEIENCTSLRYILSGGEILTQGLQQKVFAKTSAKLANLYGPTETTIDSTFWQCDPSDNFETAPIGKPIGNLKTYILNDHFLPVPVGVPGEICVGGVGLARGYHNRPGLTAERFLPDPFSNESGSRLYKTGDLGRFRSDGCIEFLGRVDEQVKIRGYRIELGEIDLALKQHVYIEEAVTTIYVNSSSEAQLIAYVVCEEGGWLSSKELTSYLEERLPVYMIPSFFIFLDKLPKTPNGKINRSALPIPSRKRENTNYLGPTTAVEKEVARAFENVLNLEHVSINDDFFALGGSSLMLARLASQLLTRFELSIPMAQFFRIPTIQGVSEVVTTFQQEGLEAVMAKKHATRLEEDATLDNAIRPKGLPMANFLNPSCVFLTGATGYLGAFLLERLIKNTQAKIFCLVRAKDEADAMDRLVSTMDRYHIWHEEYRERICPMIGDLASPQLGLSDESWELLTEKVDSIYHSGAMVNFAYPYSALRAANVLGTKEILKLSCLKRLKAVHYISTIDVLLATHTPRPLLENDSILQHEVDIPGGYTASKWVVEKVVNIAMERGLPICIYRPGLILGHSETGAVQTNDYLLVAFRGFVSMGILPEYPRIFDTISVNYAASAVVHISMQATSFGKFFHLFSTAPVPLSSFYKWTQTFGYQFNEVDFEEARRLGVKVDASHPLYPLVPLLREADPTPQPSLDPLRIGDVKPELECFNTLTALAGSGIECDLMTEDFTHRFLKYLISIDFLKSPEDLKRIRNEESFQRSVVQENSNMDNQQ